ncbi:hypothetical protein [Streptomyces sp. PvR018]|uniref:hypothetical protein n=1 Tax=Streptomyces sp. PvR018 TaxID=3156442 RepID=UPI003394A95F
MKTVSPFTGTAPGPVPPPPSPFPAGGAAASDSRRRSLVDAPTGLCGCEIDHGLDASAPADPDDVWCQVESDDVHVPIDANGTPESMRVLSSTLNVLPCADLMALWMLHMSVEAVQDEWIEGLATVISTLYERVERLQRAHSRLEFGRVAYRAAR